MDLKRKGKGPCKKTKGGRRPRKGKTWGKGNYGNKIAKSRRGEVRTGEVTGGLVIKEKKTKK